MAAFVGNRAARAGSQGAEVDLAALIGRGNGAAAPDASLAQTQIVQPALFALWYSLADTMREWGIRPATMLGYSLGEYVAACLSGVLSFTDALALVTYRAH